MGIEQMKKTLIEKIESAKGDDVKTIYRLYQTVAKNKKDNTPWADLSSEQKHRIENGINELDKGMGLPLKNVVENIKRKHGIKN
jgi:hypothetical protein